MNSLSPLEQRIKKAAKLNFGLFFLFFVFYVGAAVLQTPSLKAISEIVFLGMPLGLFVSLAVFPVSWIILVLWFRRAS